MMIFILVMMNFFPTRIIFLPAMIIFNLVRIIFFPAMIIFNLAMLIFIIEGLKLEPREVHHGSSG